VRDIVMTLTAFSWLFIIPAMKQFPYSACGKIRPDHPDISSSCSLPHVLVVRCSSRLRVYIRTAEFIVRCPELHISLCQWKMGMKIRNSMNMHKKPGENPHVQNFCSFWLPPAISSDLSGLSKKISRLPYVRCFIPGDASNPWSHSLSRRLDAAHLIHIPL
jgi:hypothetical protein